jgi:N-acetylglucosamine kinase-like BadF-type ATPase
MQTVLGIDGGGSKTVFLMVDDQNTELARIETGPSNLTSVGSDRSRQAIEDGLVQLPSPPDVISAGFAGAGSPEGAQHYRSVLTDLAPKARIIVETDAHMAYVGALGLSPGIVFIAGTGCMVTGRTSEGTTFRYGGWGPHFGDEGGGYWIGREAIRTALAFREDGRESNFPNYIAKSLGLARIEDVIPAWSTGALDVPRVASLTQRLTDRFPDEPGAGILKAAAGQLKRLIDRGITHMGQSAVRISAVGSLATHPVIRGLIGIRFEPPEASPEQGAIAWARQHPPDRVQVHTGASS